MNTLSFVRLSEKAYPLMRASENATGFDLSSAYDYVIPPKGKELIKTDIAIKLPSGCYGRIAPRSGITWKYFLDVGAGVIDRDYRGNICVVLFNFGDKEFKVERGMRIAQLICEKFVFAKLIEKNSLDVTDRDDKGFGSTGVMEHMIQ